VAITHAWGHAFSDTVEALASFAGQVHERFHKESPEDVTFWIDVFAVNRHRAEEEYASDLERAPFRAAVAKAQHGAAMVLDEEVKPFRRVWPLFEVHCAHELGRPLELVTREGLVTSSSVVAIEIAGRLANLSAIEATANSAHDWYVVTKSMTEQCLRSLSMAQFKKMELGRIDFWKFDSVVGGILATPLLRASLDAADVRASLVFIGLGAECGAATLAKMMHLGADLREVKVRTRFASQVGLLHVFAYFGWVEPLRFVLEQGASAATPDSETHTPLHRASREGHLDAAALLLEYSAPVAASDGVGCTPLHRAASIGHRLVADLLINHRAPLSTSDNNGMTPLHRAVTSGHCDVVKLLLERGAMVRGAGSGKAARIPLRCFAEQAGHYQVAELLREYQYQ